MPSEYTPRLSVEVSAETFNRFTDIIPWGLRSKVLCILVDDLLSQIDKHGNIVLSALVNRSIGVAHIVPDVGQAIKKKEKEE